MRRKLFPAVFSLVILICAAAALPSSAQKKQPDAAVLAQFERSIEQGKINEIERSLLNYAVAHPNEAKILELLALVRLRQNRLTEAESLYRRVLALDANSFAAKINLARIAFESGQTQAAQQTLGEIESSTAVLPPTQRLELARVFLLTGEFQKALQAADKLPLKTKNSDALPVIAAAYLATNTKEKLNELFPLMKKAASVNPNLATDCAEVLQNAKMNREAAELLRAAIGADPNNFKALILLTKSEIAARDFAAAEKHLSQAAKIQPRSAEIFMARAMLEEKRGNVVASLDALKQARQIAPESNAVASQFVIAAMRANQPRAAFEAAEKLIALAPDNPEFRYLHGAAALQNGNLNAAQQSLETFLAQRPNDSRGCLALGLTLAARPDRIEAARKQLFHCLEINPNDFEAKYQLGLSYRAQGETAKAIEFLEAAAKIAPDYPLALRDLGALYLQTNDEPKARMVLEKSVALNDKDADTHFQLSRLYNLIGETALAKRHLEAFQKLRNQGEK